METATAKTTTLPSDLKTFFERALGGVVQSMHPSIRQYDGSRVIVLSGRTINDVVNALMVVRLTG